jgi:hypothetical protein
MAEPKKRGRPASNLKIEGDWQSAIGRALSRKRPEGGFPGGRQEAGPPGQAAEAVHVSPVASTGGQFGCSLDTQSTSGRCCT